MSVSKTETSRWIPAGRTASLYGAAAALILAGFLISSRDDSTTKEYSSNGVLGGAPTPALEANALIDAVGSIRFRHNQIALLPFLKKLLAKTATLSPNTRDAILDKHLRNILDDEISDPDAKTQNALAEAIRAFSNPGFRALGFGKLASKCSSVEDSNKYAELAWSAIAESGESSRWYLDAFNTAWPIVSLVLGFVLTNTFAAFFEAVGEHRAKTWIIDHTTKQELARAEDTEESDA